MILLHNNLLYNKEHGCLRAKELFMSPIHGISQFVYGNKLLKYISFDVF